MSRIGHRSYRVLTILGLGFLSVSLGTQVAKAQTLYGHMQVVTQDMLNRESSFKCRLTALLWLCPTSSARLARLRPEWLGYHQIV